MFKRVKDIKRVLETSKHCNKFKLSFPLKLFSSSNPVVKERLNNLDEDFKAKYSWLQSEEAMRNHLNILDWDQIEKEEKFKRMDSLNRDKNVLRKEPDDDELKRLTNDFREKIFDFSNKSRVQKYKNNDDDYEIPNEVVNFERTVDMSKFKKQDKYEQFNKDNQEIQTQLDYLKDKPKNYLLVGNIRPNSDIEELLIIIKSLGQVVKFNVINDLDKRPCLIEVYYYTEKEAYKAKMTLDYYKFNDFFLTAKSYKDYESEHIDSRTLIVGNLPIDIEAQDIVDIFSNHGNVMKVELPLQEIKNKNKKIYDDLVSNNNNHEKNLETIFNYSDKYFEEFLDSNIKSNNSKLNFFYQYKKVKDILNQISQLTKKEITLKHAESLKSLYEQFKFYIQKIFPKEIVNSLIFNEIIKNKDDVDVLDGFAELNKEKLAETYNKIYLNMSSLISKYDDKVKVLAEELTEEMIPIDMSEKEYKKLHPERLHTTYTKKALDEKDPKVQKTDLRQINFMSLCTPLNEQIEKIKLYRSLSPEERDLIKEKYNIDFKVNTPQFIDYFLQYSKAIGIDIFEKQIEIANLFLSMSPVEKQYLGRKLAKNPDKLIHVKELVDFLDLKKRNYLNTPVENLKLLNKVNDLDKSVSERLFSLSYKSNKKPYIRDILVTEKINFEYRIKQKYLEYWSKNYRNKRLSIVYTIKLDDFINETMNLKELIDSSGDLYIKKYKDRIEGLMIPDEEEHKKKLLSIKINSDTNNSEPPINADNTANYTGNSSYTELNSNQNISSSKEVNPAENKSSSSQEVVPSIVQKLDPKLDFEIKNRLDELEHEKGILINKVHALNKYILPKNSSFDIFKEHVKNKLISYANSLIGDKSLKMKILDKLEDSLKFLKYVDCNFEEKEFKMWQLVEDLVAKEIEYVDKTRNIKRFFKELEDLFVGPIDKDSLVKILSTYEIIQKADTANRGDYDTKKTFYSYFQTVQETFFNELEKLEEIKETKAEENKAEIGLDELYNERKELIENYVNKVYAMEEYQKLRPKLDNETKEELEKYKLKNIGKSNLFLESDSEAELEVIKTEIKKKKFENIKTKGNTDQIEVNSIFSNLNAEKELKENFDISLKNKIQLMIKKKSVYNRGYCFLTFANSDQAKRTYFLGNEIVIEGNKIKLLPKLTTTHEDLDFNYLKEKGQSNLHYIEKKNEIEKARQKLNEFESNFKDKIDKSHEDYKKVIDGYKDIFSDPYKRHDKEYNPFDSDEERVIKENIKKQEKESKLNHLWLYEDDKLEELRRVKDKKITNKYLDWQLLKRGVIPEKKKKIPNENEFTFYQDVLDDMFSKDLEIKVDSDYEASNSGRNHDKKFGPGEFVQKYLGKDMLEIPAFKKDKKISQFFQPLKELSERFPKEKFIDNISDYEKAITDVKKDYIKHLKEKDKNEDENLSYQSQILDKLSPNTHVNMLINPILEERKNFITENRESITYQSFLQKAAGENFFRAEDFNDEYINPATIKFKEDEIQYPIFQPPGDEEMTEEQIMVKQEELNQRIREEKQKKLDLIEKQKEGSIFNYLEERYDVSKNPKNLDILPYGFKGKKLRKDKLDKLQELMNINYVNDIQEHMLKEMIDEENDVEVDVGEKNLKEKIKGLGFKYNSKNPKGKKSKTKEEDDDGNDFQFDENILSQDKIRDIKSKTKARTFSNQEQIMKSVLKKFNALNGKGITGNSENVSDEENLNQFEIFINNKSTQKNDILSKVKSKNFDENYEKFKKVENLNSGFQGFKENVMKSEKEKEEEMENLKTKIKLEKEKVEFFQDLASNFREELEVSQKFKNYFEDLKNDKKHFNFGNSKNLHIDKKDSTEMKPMQEIVNSLHAGTFDKEIYKKYFLNQKTEEDVIKEWIKPEEIDRWNKQGKELIGMTPENEKDMLEKLKLENPEKLDEKFIKFSKNFGENFDTLLIDMIESNDIFEDEYYFNPDSHESLEDHLARLSLFPNLKISITKDQKGRHLIRREYKISYKYDLDEIMDFDIKKEKDKLTQTIEEMDFSNIFTNEIEYKYQIQNLIQKHIKIKEITDLDKIMENMKTLSLEEEDLLKKKISTMVNSEKEFNSNQKKEFINQIITSLKNSKKIDLVENNLFKSFNENNSFYINLKEILDDNLKIKIFNGIDLTYVSRNLENLIKIKAQSYLGKNLKISTLRDCILKIMSLKKNELNSVLTCLIKIVKNAKDIPIIKTSLDDNTISLLLVLVKKNFDSITNIKDNDIISYVQNHIINGLLNFITEDFNTVEKILTYSVFNLLPDDVEFVKENESFVDKNQYFSSMWTMFKQSVIKNNLASLLKSAVDTDFLKEHEFRLENDLMKTSKSEESVKNEINEYSKKIKTFYHDLIRLNPTELDWENYISDLELFSSEISEQISNKLYRKKYLTKWKKSDFVEERINEENLYNVQVAQIRKALNTKIPNEDLLNDQELLEIQENIKRLKQRKERLMKDKRPILNNEYLRII